MSAGHAALLLAAGGSARLGRPKQLLSRESEPLVHRAARLALATAPSRLLVVLGAQREAVAQALADLSCECIAHAGWRAGLGSSLAAAAPQLQGADAVLVLACDQPALELRHLQALLEGARAAASGCAATRHGAALGVPAVVPGAWFADASTLAGDRGFGARLRTQPPGAVFALQAPELAFDLDTPNDLARARMSGLADPKAPAAATQRR